MWRHKSSPRGVDRFIINQAKKTNATHTTTSLIPALFPKFSTVTFSAVCSGGVRVNDLPLLNMKVRLLTYSFYYTVWLTIVKTLKFTMLPNLNLTVGLDIK